MTYYGVPSWYTYWSGSVSTSLCDWVLSNFVISPTLLPSSKIAVKRITLASPLSKRYVPALPHVSVREHGRVAVALTAGGPGAIFWMWLIAMLGMATSFAESTLAQLYKTRDKDGNYRGGPAYYMEKGLGMRWMGVLFSIFLIIAFGLVFNAVQANSITNAMKTAFGLNPC